MDFPDHPFWDFSIAVHQRPGVHEACLALQTRYGIDVNLLFFCCWVGAAGGGKMDPEKIRHAMDAVAGWQEEIVRPIWKARWRLKPSFNHFPAESTEPLRRCLIEAELDAEHIEQLQLARAISIGCNPDLPEETKAADVVANIFAYLTAFFKEAPDRVPEKEYLADPLAVLVSACFPDADRSRLSALMNAQWR